MLLLLKFPPRQSLLLLKLPPRQSLPLLKLPLRQSSKHQPPHRSFKHRRLKHQLLLPLHQLLPKHRLLPLVQLFRVEPLRANQRVTRLAKLLALLLHVPIRRDRRPRVAHLVSLLRADPLVRRLVVP